MWIASALFWKRVYTVYAITTGRDYHIQGGVIMTNITYIGMDVHTAKYTLCAFTMEGKKAFGRTAINPDIKELVIYLEMLNKQMGVTAQFECGYEQGCLGYTLYHALTARGYKYVILAPTTMLRRSRLTSGMH